MVWLSRAKLALPLPQIEAIADIRAGVIRNPGYANCCDIVSGFEIFSALNLTADQEVHAVCRHSRYPLFAFIPSLTNETDARFAFIRPQPAAPPMRWGN